MFPIFGIFECFILLLKKKNDRIGRGREFGSWKIEPMSAVMGKGMSTNCTLFRTHNQKGCFVAFDKKALGKQNHITNPMLWLQGTFLLLEYTTVSWGSAEKQHFCLMATGETPQDSTLCSVVKLILLTPKMLVLTQGYVCWCGGISTTVASLCLNLLLQRML